MTLVDEKILWIMSTGCVLGALLFWGARQAVYIVKVRRRRRRGIKAEEKTGAILQRYGYQLIESQPSFKLSMIVDRQRVDYTVRPDGIAARKGKIYLVEVKTGPTAGDYNYSNTRRQMLEYCYGIPSDGLLFVNADQEKVRLIQFPKTNRKMSRFPFWAILVGFFIGVLVTVGMNFYN